MKNFISFMLVFFTSLCFSQLTLKKLDGTPINNGDVITFTAITDPEAYLGLKFFNSSATDINVKAEVMSILNSDGTNLQFCFGNICVSSINENTSYPNLPAIIPANGQNGNFDHFINLAVGTNPSAPVEFVLRFYQINNLGTEIGNSITFTYRYASNLSINSFENLENLGVKIKSNVVSNQLELEVSKSIQTQIFDINAKLLDSQNLVAGNQTIDISKLNSGIYFLNFINEENKKSTLRFIKK